MKFISRDKCTQRIFSGRLSSQSMTFEFLENVFTMQWLWELFAGFYLVAYAFWDHVLFNTLLTMIFFFSATLILGIGLGLEGLWRAMSVQRCIPMPTLPAVRLWWFLGGILLSIYAILVYIPVTGRIVPHWPLDLAITVISIVTLFAYAVSRQDRASTLYKIQK